MKTTIARHLIEQYTHEGDIVIDPYCGSGVVPLEAVTRNRHVIAGDTNPYGVLLTRAKLFPPASKDAALKHLEERWAGAICRLKQQDLRTVPSWVRRFFHPETLREALAFRDECFEKHDWFLLACLLGILHHQRPGFLSYPSSHLVPYLRDKLFPRDKYPELYQKRDVLLRLRAKVERAFKRPAWGTNVSAQVWNADSRHLPLSQLAHAVVTSPPYMNELDYVRDNRLRLWLLNRANSEQKDLRRRDREQQFRQLIRETSCHIATRLHEHATFAFVVGEVTRGGKSQDSAQIIIDEFRITSPLNQFRLIDRIDDKIPDIRRSRRDLRGTKNETVLIFKRG